MTKLSSPTMSIQFDGKERACLFWDRVREEGRPAFCVTHSVDDSPETTLFSDAVVVTVRYCHA